jgi:hypothetical protein
MSRSNPLINRNNLREAITNRPEAFFKEADHNDVPLEAAGSTVTITPKVGILDPISIALN